MCVCEGPVLGRSVTIGQLDQWQIGMDLNHLQRYQVHYAFGPINGLGSEHQSEGQSLEGENGAYQTDARTISDFASIRDIPYSATSLGHTICFCSRSTLGRRPRQP